MDADAGKKLLEAARDKDFAKKAEEVMGVNGATKTDFQNLVRESMADFNKTLLAGGDGDIPARINQNVERLALRYMMDGYETEEAVEKAAGKVILDRYSLAGPTGKQFRVPRKFNADQDRRRRGSVASGCGPCRGNCCSRMPPCLEKISRTEPMPHGYGVKDIG